MVTRIENNQCDDPFIVILFDGEPVRASIYKETTYLRSYSLFYVILETVHYYYYYYYYYFSPNIISSD
jgi:hypothetical protein